MRGGWEAEEEEEGREELGAGAGAGGGASCAAATKVVGMLGAVLELEGVLELAAAVACK